mgnify:CR=1 FL=1
MRTSTALVAVAFLAACGSGADAPADEAPMDEAAATMDAAPTMADFAGTWELTANLEGTDAPVEVRLEGSADGMWTMYLQDREPMMTEAMMMGDSLVMEIAPYESVLREGVMVSTRSAVVIDGDRMMGNLVATYQTPEGEEVVSGTMEGARSGM